ncbi:hypothetical protein A4H34_03295 [Peptidiphaga gingivicola]|uniref:Uncharacterized protein n=1 Tax=Peptidiphaga gingivicola TaxID=2741497 RepID=A0A179B4B4_9ACTO|nr:hypothetical protein [Peptidiphaga gingivicola]OAP86209.1 hypothetical protein A4H34_03295 [Peptidiphaga gingivicola]
MVVRQLPGWSLSVRADMGRPRRGASDAKKRLCLRGAVVALGVCLACLTGCRIDAKVEFKADGGQYTEIVFEDTTDSMRTLKGNCEELREYFGTTARYAAAAKMEDITAPGGHLRCKATSNILHDEVTVKDNGDTLSISMKSSPPDGADLDGLTMTTTITMPGKVIKSSIGKVHGNKVVIDGYDYPITGFTITSRKNDSASPATEPSARQSTTSTATSTGTQGSHGDSSLWVWTGVGCTTLAALTLGGLTFFRTARKKKQHSTAQATNSSRPETVSAGPSGGPNWSR